MNKKFRNRLYDIVFEADTRAGKIFDVLLLVFIILSVALVMLESVGVLRMKYVRFFIVSEWIVTILFSLEYILRVAIVNKPRRYILSFYGIIDLLSLLPTYLAIFIVGSQSLVVIRILRLLRVFRVFKITRYIQESSQLIAALKASRVKIGIFLFFVLNLTIVLGALMYLVEGEENGFTSIPRSIYWAIVTLTTVGYGDIAPQTAHGQAIASLVMIIGYAIIAVPTGIVSVAMHDVQKKTNTQVCPECLTEGHEVDAIHCKKCGAKLNT